MNKLYAHLGGLMQEKKRVDERQTYVRRGETHNKEQKLIIMID